MAIYLDNAATTPVDPRVYEAMIPYFTTRFANPSSVHVLGREEREAVETSRATIARTIGAEPHEIVFTASGSEADNMAVIGMAYALKGKGNHIITSSIEHKAILESCKYLEKNGFEVTYLPVESNGIVSMDTFRAAIRKDTILVSIMLGNNEVGTLQPVKEIAEVCRAHGIIVHTDAVQAVGKLPVDVNDLGVHLLSVAGHKIYAPKGIGFLYIDEELKSTIVPLIHGGSHEYGLRAGTPNTPYIVGLAKACEIIQNELTEETARIKALRDHFEKRVLTEIGDTFINGDVEKRVCNVSNVVFKYIESEALMVYASDICMSTGSACSSDSVDASHVLYAMKVDPVHMHGAVRFSFGRFTTEEDVNTAVEILKSAVGKLRAMSPLYNRPE